MDIEYVRSSFIKHFDVTSILTEQQEQSMLLRDALI